MVINQRPAGQPWSPNSSGSYDRAAVSGAVTAAKNSSVEESVGSGRSGGVPSGSGGGSSSSGAGGLKSAQPKGLKIVVICVIIMCIGYYTISHQHSYEVHASHGPVDGTGIVAGIVVHPDHSIHVTSRSTNTTKRYPLTLWSSDFHISPVADIKNIVSAFGATVIDKSLSGHCHLANTCERDLRVINKQNGIHLEPCPNDVIAEFYNVYK
jgi:hypothetical protein